MLQISLPEREFFNENDQTFVQLKPRILRMEHSLISLAKWESNWNKPFLSKEPKSFEEVVDYLKCMSLDGDLPEIIFYTLPNDIIDKINNYMEKSMTATWFSDNNERPNREILTAELIYCSMIQLGIPFECQKWHLNRLLTLIRVCSIKMSPPKKMGKQQILAQNRELNAARRAKYNTKG